MEGFFLPGVIMTTKSKAKIMDAKALDRALTRIAHEIIERNKGVENLVIIGMQTRGVKLAKIITEKIKSIEKRDVLFGVLDVTLYRDDFRAKLKQPVVKVTEIPFQIDNTNIILVDDVLYTGRTVRAALDELMDFGRPKSIQLAVLIDRGHRELPIKAEYVGKNVPTSVNEEVAVKVKDVDGEDGVDLVEINKK